MTSEEGLVADSLVEGVSVCHYGLPSVFLGMLIPFLGALKGDQQAMQLCSCAEVCAHRKAQSLKHLKCLQVGVRLDVQLLCRSRKKDF